MTAHTQHPIAAPPAAPIREKTGHLLLRGWCILVLAGALSGTSLLMVFGATVAGVLVYGSAILSLVLWLVVRPSVQWRRLPWFAAGYVGLAVLSLIWTAWTTTSLITLGLLLSTTIHGVFAASVLTWRELVRAIASALKWIKQCVLSNAHNPSMSNKWTIRLRVFYWSKRKRKSEQYSKWKPT